MAFTTACNHRMSGCLRGAWVVGASCAWVGESCGVLALGGVTDCCCVVEVGLVHRSLMTLSQAQQAPRAKVWCSGPMGPWLVQKRVPPGDRQSLGVAPRVGVCGSLRGVACSELMVVGTACAEVVTV